MVKQDHVADTVVIGGGIAGSSAAFRLAEQGQKVILLEKGRVGEEASGRNSGGVRQQDRDPLELPFAMEAIKIWEKMEDELEFDVGYRRGGNLKVARSMSELESFTKTAERERSMGLTVEILSPEETRELTSTIPSDLEIFGGKYCPTDGQANPLLVVKSICNTARRLGVIIKEYEPVIRLTIKSDRVTAAVTNRDEYYASCFINAAGPWAKNLTRPIGIDYPARLIKGKIFISESLPPMVKEFVTMNEIMYRQTLEGNFEFSMLTTRFVEDYEKNSELHDFQLLGKRISRFLPCLRNVHLLRSFAALDHVTPDTLPILDKAPFQNLFLAAPLGGHGFCIGPIIGKLIAEWIVNEKTTMDLRPMRLDRFQGPNQIDKFKSSNLFFASSN